MGRSGNGSSPCPRLPARPGFLPWVLKIRQHRRDETEFGPGHPSGTVIGSFLGQVSRIVGHAPRFWQKPPGGACRAIGQLGSNKVDRAAKKELVENLSGVFNETSLVVVGHYSGLTVAEITDLRRQMRAAGASFKVSKNRLTKLALKDTKFEGLSDLMKGPTAIAYSTDPVAAAKVAVDYAKKNKKFVLQGAVMGGQALDVGGIEALATLPSLDELRGKLLGMLQTPASRIASVLQAPGGQVARVLAAYAKKDEEQAA